MGRRKERRLAAMTASGRRVKLDLFVDSSPGEASLKEGTGGGNHDQQTVVPTSPSSSARRFAFGKKENPLALLGQYSDDEEEDEEGAGQPTDETKESPRDANTKVTHEHVDTAGDKGNAHTELLASVGEQPDASKAGENCTSNAEDSTVAPEPMLDAKNTEATEGIPDTSGMQIVGDVGGNWKAVMHEQSNQCYYWNTVTGETSWEMPNGLTSGVASVPTTHMDYSMEAQAHVHPQTALEVYPTEVSVGNGASAYATFGMECVNAQFTQDAYAYTASATSHEDIDPLQLAKYGEGLLQRLSQLERIPGSVDGLELIRREIGIRISDCNALSAYGSSLLPLWLHAEVHLKQLDSSISKLETSNSTDVEPRCLETDVAEEEGHKAPNEVDLTAPSNGEDLKFEAGSEVTTAENAKIEELIPTSFAQSSLDKGAEAITPSKVEIDNDEDMDVDMEVDEDDVDEQMNSNSVTKEQPTPEQVGSPNLPSLGGLAPEDNDPPPPPPPEEEWVPPPPPDSEPAPPPPEEPAASYVHPDTVAQPYIGQANVVYTLVGTEYYASVGAEGTSATYYAQASEPHVLQAQQHSCYAPVSACGISVPVVDGTSIAQESYYTYPSVPTAAGGIADDHSGYYTSSDFAVSSSAVEIKSSTSHVSANSNSNPTSIGSDRVISKDAGAPLLNQAVAIPATGTTSVLGSSTQASTSTTSQTKVVRSKKRPVAVTSSLRSNKKVSSLVDKWKAAKDELRDEEEEPENALEALERKRQKEIEEWRKQQITSGEAKENANFVPVRGDWRDRVKRRRAEAKKEAKDESNNVSLSTAEHHNKGQPDLAELSNGLPSGWQAYLDESTKQVYYGNNLTSETTWVRPNK